MATKVLVILGPTASGKSALAVGLAKKFNGEVVSADSRQVYRGLDIGTGKITKKEMGGIPHHLLNVASPKRQFSVVRYIVLARKTIDDILRRGKLPILCGGSGFYISALLGEETIPDAPPNPKLRAKLAGKSPDELFQMLQKIDPERARSIDRHNPRRLVRAIEIALGAEKNQTEPRRQSASGGRYGARRETRPKGEARLQPQVLKIGLSLPPEELKEKITIRLFARLPVRNPKQKRGMKSGIRKGMIEETKRLHKRGLSWKRMEELGLEYRYLARYLQGKISKKEMVEKLKTEIWHYAKRQMTWFRRDKNIKWFKPSEQTEIEKEIKKFLRR